MKEYTLKFYFKKKCNPKYAWSRTYWKFLHTMADNYPEKPTLREKIGYEQFIYTFINVIPCHECRNHYYTFVLNNPPILKSKKGLVRWIKKLSEMN